MSFAKLGYRLQDPPTSSSTKSVTEYLTKPLFPQDFTDVKNASVKDKELAPLIGYFKYMWTMVMPQQEQATNSDMKHAIDQLSSNGKFTTLIAAACHLMLRTLFQNLCAQYKRLDSLEPSELEHADDGNDGSRIFEEHLPDIVFALEVLNFFAHSDLLKHLMRSTNVAPSTPGTPKHQQSRRDIKTEDNEFGSSTFPSPVTPPQHQEEGEDDDFDGLDWQDTFVNWLKRLVRQYASAQHLTLLKDTWRSRISHLNMGIVLEPKPNNKMQPWRAAIREIAQSDSKRLRQCMMTMGYLVTIEQNVRDNMDSIRRLWAPLVKPMDGRKWEDCFWGTIHGEAAVAAVYAQNQQPRVRVYAKKPVRLLIGLV